MIGGADKITSAFGHIHPGGHFLFLAIVARAVKMGFHVHLLQPGSSERACTLSDRQAAQPHDCWHPLQPQENPARVRPMVRMAMERAEERYGRPLNVGIELLPSGYFLPMLDIDEWGPPTLYSDDSDVFASWWLRTIPEEAHMEDLAHLRKTILPVPPSVFSGGSVPVRCWSTSDRG